MKYIDEYRNSELAQKIIASINRLSHKQINLMEFCGGHTISIMRNGLRQLLPPTIKMLSGPGCPVCVTSNSDIDKVIALSGLPDMIITTFGDMIKVPGSYSSLRQTRAEGADIRIVYSTLDALQIATDNPGKSVIFIGIGFETTAPTIAASIVEAQSRNIRNYSVLSLVKTCPPVVKAVLDLGEIKIDGIIGPGHVSAVTGSRPFEFIARDYGISFVISGFEPMDILMTVEMLVRQIEEGKPEVDIAYRRGVRPEGNVKALEMINRVFEEDSADWRGIGVIPGSGLKIRREYQQFDADANFKVDLPPVKEAAGCICGEIIRAVKTPDLCPLFNKVCTPENPVGPCMVSSEGTCTAYYSYGEKNG